jgi:hypothetical protein
MDTYAVTRPSSIGTVVACHFPDGTEWMGLREAWRHWTFILTWETEHGAEQFAAMNGGTVTPLAEVFDPSVILGPSETRSPQHDRRSAESPRIDPPGVGPDGGTGSGTYRDTVRQPEMVRPVSRDEPATWLVVVWLVVVLLLAITAKYGVVPS